MKAHQFEMVLPAPSTDSVLKDRAHRAFVAFQDAERAGDTAAAEAATKRFLAASALIGR